jgi:uncharacterized protein YuzE
MRFEYDKEVDAAYIYLKYPINEGEAIKQVEVNKNIILDLDNQGKILGMEILNASKVLRKELLV